MRLPPVLALLTCLLTLPMTSPAQSSNDRPIALVIHGGAGVIDRGKLSPADEALIRADLERALEAGQRVLAADGTAMDAAIAAVRVLEDSPRFNAGHGAVFNAQGQHELDASVMEGHTRRAGAVAGVRTIRNPVALAHRVMEASPHVMLMGDGAEAFADAHADIARVPNTYFDTDARRRQLELAQQKENAQALDDLPTVEGAYFGTVGAVALDRQGHVAAATSTGGMTNKKWGRVGDSPIVGAGTYADARCGVSGTGWGEFFIRAAVAHDICARMAYGGATLQQAADEVIMNVVPALGGDGGAIALDAQGNIAMPFNTSGMYRGWVKPDGTRGVAIFRED